MKSTWDHVIGQQLSGIFQVGMFIIQAAPATVFQYLTSKEYYGGMGDLTLISITLGTVYNILLIYHVG